MKGKISKTQQAFYDRNKKDLIDDYLADFPLHIDPDAVRDRFAPIGYNRSNVQQFKEIGKLLTKEIFIEALRRNKSKIRKVIFAAGLPASGKTSHLKMMAKNELIYDGTINNQQTFLALVGTALNDGFAVEVFVYSAETSVAFARNLKRGDETGRYVPVLHYEKVADSINKRESLVKHHFKSKVRFRNFEHTHFQGKQKKFSPLIVNRDELKRIAGNHKFPDRKTFQQVIA